MLDDFWKSLLEQGIQQFAGRVYRILQKSTLFLDGFKYGGLIQVPYVGKKDIGMQGPDIEAPQDLCRKILEVVSDDNRRAAFDGSRQDVSVISIGEIEPLNQGLMIDYQAIRNCLIHELNGSIQVRLCQVGTVFQHISCPLVVDLFRPARAIDARQSEVHQQIT
ncbi:hypothetical protein APT63_17020 [Pseudomonas sp. 22-AL-CL-001]|nr:hypothetical protein APT63_17020 [Pseudomonas monteilii]